MTKGYKIETNIILGDRFIIVSNSNLNNIVFNFGTYNLHKSLIEPTDIGVWKKKSRNEKQT
jgi:hypothetical protein